MPLEGICRACLFSDNEHAMVALDETFISSYNLLTNLSVTLMDGMSQYLCQSCAQTIRFYLEFREKCITSESILQQNVKQMDIKAENSINNNGNSLDEDTLKVRNSSRNNIETATTINTKNNNGVTNVHDMIMDIKEEIKNENIDESSIFEDTYFEVFADFSTEYEDLIKIEDEKPMKQKKEKLIKDLLCGICEKTFKEDALNTHLDTHKNMLRCQICSETFNHWPGLLAHRISHVADQHHRCHICSKHYKTKLGMEHHYMTLHFEGEKIGLQCQECGGLYETPRKLRKHVWSVHSRKHYMCDHCNKVFNNKQGLKNHLKSHSEDKQFICDLCGFSCKYNTGLKDHYTRKHVPQKIYCKNCDRPFRSQEAHDKHKCNSVTVICPICGKTILKRNRLKRHMDSHSQVGQYKCDRCTSVFKTRYALSVHIDRHDGERRNQCEYCQRKFYSCSTLIKHRRVHTGEKPYVCKICQKGFTANHNLKVHMKVHGEHNLIVKRNKEQIDATINEYYAKPNK